MPDGYGVCNIRLPCYLLVQRVGLLSGLSRCFRQILGVLVAAVMTSQQRFLLSQKYELKPVQRVPITRDTSHPMPVPVAARSKA